MIIAVIIIILLVVIALFYMLEIIYDDPIDIVYTWVDEYDPEREFYKAELLQRDSNNESSRYKQNDELKYSIRSIQKYCNWFNKIYIVVKDGQKPDFIDFNNPKIVLVNHSSIMPKSALPTFNSVAIELCLHNIPGLCDKYVYFNDDIFVVDFIDKYTLFSFGCKPKVNFKPNHKIKQTAFYKNSYYQWEILFNNSVAHANKILNTNISISNTHTPSICYKPWEKELEKLLQNYDNNIWERTVNSKFRNNYIITINNVVRPIFYFTKGSKLIIWNETYINTKKGCSIKIKPHSKFICINNIEDNCKESYQNIMDKLYSEKSCFEN
jgi:hypothetical protein